VQGSGEPVILSLSVQMRREAKSRGPHRSTLTRVSSLRLYGFVACAFLALITFETWLSNRPLIEQTQSDLSEFNKKEIDSFTDTNKLLTALATALIGATTGFLLNRDHKAKLSPPDFRRAICSWVAAGISLYFGQLSYREMLWMLQHRFCDLFHDSVWWPARIQFWAFLISAISLADFVYRSVQENSSMAKSP
jgi:hypothetical protein